MRADQVRRTSVEGQVFVDTPSTTSISMSLAIVSASLMQNTLVHQVPLSDIGNFNFNNIQPGQYDFSLWAMNSKSLLQICRCRLCNTETYLTSCNLVPP